MLRKNFAVASIASGGAPSPATSGTSVNVTTGMGARLYVGKAFYKPATFNPLTDTAEEITISAIATDALTIVRNTDGRGAATMVDGGIIYQGITGYESEVMSCYTRGLKWIYPHGTNASFASTTSGNYSTSITSNSMVNVQINSDNGSTRQSYGNGLYDSTNDPGIPFSILSGNWVHQMRLGCASNTSFTVTAGVFRYRILSTSLTANDYLSDTVKHITVKHKCAINGSAYTQDVLEVVVGNGSAASTTTISGITLANTVKNLRLEMIDGSLRVYVDNVLKATITSGLPSLSGTNLFLGAGSIEHSGNSNYIIRMGMVHTDLGYL